MKYLLLFSVCLASAFTAEAAKVKLLSPDTAHTYAVEFLVDHSFTWNAQTQKFGADLRFDGRSATGWQEEESFRFIFPEVKFDATNRTFYVLTGDNERIPVAELRKGLLGQVIVPAPGTTVLIANEHGKVRLVLTADGNVKERRGFAPCWIERSDAWVLQNLFHDAAVEN